MSVCLSTFTIKFNFIDIPCMPNGVSGNSEYKHRSNLIYLNFTALLTRSTFFRAFVVVYDNEQMVL